MSGEKQFAFDPNYAVPPGETLREVMESLNMTQRELAVRTDLTVQTLNRIFKGEQPITYETADRLELVTGVPARFWNNLEGQYREQLVKIRDKEALSGDLRWLETIPTKELIKRNYLAKTTDNVVLLRETLRFYGVGSVTAWRDLWINPKVAARRSACFDTLPGSASAWIRMGEIEAQNIKCNHYNNSSFKSALETMRGLTRALPDVFVPEMKRLCAESGVALALIPEMKKVPWNGATKWLTSHKAMIVLNLRGKGEDRFWFSFFHEAGHVLHDNKKNLYIADDSKDAVEKAADDFAAEILIPRKYDNMIRQIRSKTDMIAMADSLGIAPGIFAGRYQYLTKKWSFYKELIRSFEWDS